MNDLLKEQIEEMRREISHKEENVMQRDILLG